MTQLRINEAAELLGISNDSVRRRAAEGHFRILVDDAGRQVIDGAELARFAVAQRTEGGDLDTGVGSRSARNHFTGLVTDVISDTVMSQVELQCGPYRVVSLISTEAVRELGLEVGSIGTAVVKATNVTVEVPR